MRRNLINVMVVLVVAGFGMAGCGGGGGSDVAQAPAVTSVKSSPVGQYSLVQTTEQMSRTAAPFTAYSSVTSTPPVWTGELALGTSSWSMVQRRASAGQAVSFNGSYQFVYDVPYQSGSFALTIPGYYPMSGRYVIVDDYTLRLTYDVVFQDGRYTYWVETWHKESDTL